MVYTGKATVQPLRWDICVVTGLLDSVKKSELANALLYGDEVLWLPIGLRLLNFFQEYAKHGQHTRSVLKPQAWRSLECYRLLRRQIAEGQLPITTPKIFSTPSSLEGKRGAAYFRTIKEEVRWFANTVKGENEEFEARLRDTRACIIEPNSKYTLQRPPHWNPDHAAQALMQALSRVLLPDVSSLPLWEVAELKEKVKDELNPMRVELLQLTDELRKMVEDECSEEEVAREAENIIKTRVLPTVSAANSHVTDQLNKGWKNYLTGTLMTISFVGLGFLSVGTGAEAKALELAFYVEAAKTWIETVADAIRAPSQPKAPTPTAQFVIALGSHLQRSNS